VFCGANPAEPICFGTATREAVSPQLDGDALAASDAEVTRTSSPKEGPRRSLLMIVFSRR